MEAVVEGVSVTVGMAMDLSDEVAEIMPAPVTPILMSVFKFLCEATRLHGVLDSLSGHLADLFVETVVISNDSEDSGDVSGDAVTPTCS
jgi:hypothetical protein